MNNPIGWQLISDSTGEVIDPGTDVETFRGETWRFECISRTPDGASTGRVLLSAACEGCTHAWHRDGIERREFFPSVVDATITRMSA